MIAGDTLARQVPNWMLERRELMTRAIAPLPGLLLTWWLVAASLSEFIWVALVVYAVLQLLLLWQSYDQTSEHAVSRRQASGWLSIAVDALLAVVLVVQVDSLALFLPLYVLITLRAFAGYARNPAVTITPFILGPVFLYQMLMLRERQPSMVAGEEWSAWVLLVGSVGFGVTAIVLGMRQQYIISNMAHELQRERNTREARVEELEHLASELRLRMRERHALEEGLRAVTSSLSLEEVLGQIVDSAVQTFGSERTHAVVLTLATDGALTNRMYTADGRLQPSAVEPLIRRVMQEQVPAVVADAALEPSLGEMSRSGLRSVLCVPLFVGEGAPRGALTVVSATFAAFSSSDARHLGAFAAQAGIAIGNAELHSRLRRQQHLLQAVLRDINDGLVVFDHDMNILLANPIVQALLDDKSVSPSWLERLRDVARSQTTHDRPTMAPELRVGGDEDTGEGEMVYQAIASQVRTDADSPALTAIVLHDITDQKAEDRARMDFISMVSHELRNPLHSLNGFVKVVLQGRAGTLTPLQQEFLSMADDQVAQLSGRIAELLEYNRFKAGRLALHPETGDLNLLIDGTVNRLMLQAEQQGLALFNYTPELPMCRLDTQRIGQVLTNLIENAMKATASGGKITVSGEIRETEVWVRVADTGVGIPAQDVPKIFQRFYQVAKHRGSTGNNLGLGLAICQQIVEGHGGRIWVESEEGVGTTFTFTLPLSLESQYIAA